MQIIFDIFLQKIYKNNLLKSIIHVLFRNLTKYLNRLKNIDIFIKYNRLNFFFSLKILTKLFKNVVNIFFKIILLTKYC